MTKLYLLLLFNLTIIWLVGF